MTKIYIIKSSGGSYDEAWENNLFGVVEEEQAKVEVQRLRDERAFLSEMRTHLQPMIQECYAQVNAYKRTPTTPEPKGPTEANREKVAEWRKAKEAWRVECEPIWKRDQEAINTIVSDGAKAVLAKARELGCEDRHIEALGFYRHGADAGISMPSFNQDVDYSYEELELR